MTPAAAIAMLDRQLAAHGSTVVLRKSNTAVGQATVKGFVRGYRPDEIVGTIQQTDKKIILSPTGLEAYGMPAAGFAITEPDGSPKAIQGRPELFRIGDTVVRIEIRVQG